jgi:hypothetical protein
MPTRCHAGILAVMAFGLAATACGPSGGAAFKDLSPQASFDCATNLFAVNNLMDIKAGNADAEFVKSNGLAAISHYGTIYAEAEKISSDEFLGLVKLKSYKMVGRIPGGPRVPDSTIISRAKACITADPA